MTSTALEFSDLDLHLQDFFVPHTPADHPQSLLATGTLEPVSPATHGLPAAFVRPHTRLPRTPAAKPTLALDTSPVTPAAPAGMALTSPAPLSLPTAHSDAGRGLMAAADEYVARETNLTARGDLRMTMARGGGASVKALLKWVTREPVALAGSYRPSQVVNSVFDCLRRGTTSLDVAMKELHEDVARHVETKKEAKRRAHKERLRTVEPMLTMDERETARHRIEASLTKFKKTESEKANHRAMRWMGEQIQAAAQGARP